MEPSLSSVVGLLLSHWDTQGTGEALLQLPWQRSLQSPLTPGLSVFAHGAVPSCDSPVHFLSKAKRGQSWCVEEAHPSHGVC